MTQEIGKLAAAIADAVLALYGEPEPVGDADIADVTDRLHRLAADRRAVLAADPSAPLTARLQKPEGQA